ncbi:MAG TPA: LamG domain-containing protein [Candidatus Paceibacterota bacterium]
MRKGFTLIELLIVIAIIAILAIVVVLTLNPVEYFRQSRDSTRVSDMDTVAHALFLYESDQGVNSVMGTASVVYVSLPDSTISGATTSTCSSLGLPTLPSGYTYQCSSPQDYKNVNGTGWIPIKFSGMTTGSPINSLPVDPTNTSSTGLYYTYNTDGISQYEVTSIFESSKFKAQYGQNPIDPDYPEVDAKGTSLSLSPLFNPTGLVGWWPLTEGSGTTAYDQSGSGNNGTWSGNTPNYTGGKVGSYAGNFDGSTDYVSIPYNSDLDNQNITVSAWVNSTGNSEGIFEKTIAGNVNTEYLLFVEGGDYKFRIEPGDVTLVGPPRSSGAWDNVVGVYNGSNLMIYTGGVLRASTPASITITAGNGISLIGRLGDSIYFLSGSVDDVRVYNRALSAAEVQALYDAEK